MLLCKNINHICLHLTCIFFSLLLMYLNIRKSPSHVHNQVCWFLICYAYECYSSSLTHCTDVIHIRYMRAIRKVTSIYFRQLMSERGRARACEMASHESLSCKPLYNWSPSVCSCLYEMSYDVSCDS
jgi:hypothetical protein